jgi:hypothetical protein
LPALTCLAVAFDQIDHSVAPKQGKAQTWTKRLDVSQKSLVYLIVPGLNPGVPHYRGIAGLPIRWSCEPTRRGRCYRRRRCGQRGARRSAALRAWTASRRNSSEVSIGGPTPLDAEITSANSSHPTIENREVKECLLETRVWADWSVETTRFISRFFCDRHKEGPVSASSAQSDHHPTSF